MENEQFDIDGSRFSCVECMTIIEVLKAASVPRTVTCEECETEYEVARGKSGGLAVVPVTKSESDIITDEEIKLEDLEEDE